MNKIKNYFFKPLVLIGALNWGLVGFFGFDLVATIFGSGTHLTRAVYSIVGLAAVGYILTMMSLNEKK